MSGLEDENCHPIEEKAFRNLLKVQDNIDNVLDEVDKVVDSTENDLFLVSNHQINIAFSKVLDEVAIKPKGFTNSNGTSQKKFNILRTNNGQHRIYCDDKTIRVGGQDFLHTKDASMENFTSQIYRACEKPLKKNVNFLISSSEKTEKCDENQQYFSKREEFSSHNNKSDGVGIKRTLLSSPKQKPDSCEEIRNETHKKISKKRKIDFSNEFCFTRQTQYIKMDMKLARKNFRGPIGIPTDSIAVILDTEKPATSYKYPIKKPEYKIPQLTFNRTNQKISITICTTKKCRKIKADPYIEDCIELTDAFLMQELDQEYNKIVQKEWSKIIIDEEEDNNFLNSPNRIIQLIEGTSGSSTEDSSETELTKIFLANNTRGQEKIQGSSKNKNFKENVQPQKKKSLWEAPSNEEANNFPGIVRLQNQTDVDIINLRKSSNCEEDQLLQFLKNNTEYNYLENSNPISDCSSSSPHNFVPSLQLDIAHIDNKKIPVFSPSNSSSYNEICRSLTNLKSDDTTNLKDQDYISETFLSDDIQGENKTLLNNDLTLIEEKVNDNIESLIVPVQTKKLDNSFKVTPQEINVHVQSLNSSNDNDNDFGANSDIFTAKINDNFDNISDKKGNDFLVSVNKENILDDQNVKNDLSSQNQDEDTEIVSNEIKEENISIITNNNYNVIYLSGSDHEERNTKNKSLDKDKKVSDENYFKKEFIYKLPYNQDEDIIELSDCSVSSRNEKTISECLKSNKTNTFTNTFNMMNTAKRLLKKQEYVIDLLSSSSNSIISINSDSDADEQDDTIICGGNNTNGNVKKEEHSSKSSNVPVEEFSSSTDILNGNSRSESVVDHIERNETSFSNKSDAEMMLVKKLEEENIASLDVYYGNSDMDISATNSSATEEQIIDILNITTSTSTSNNSFTEKTATEENVENQNQNTDILNLTTSTSTSHFVSNSININNNNNKLTCIATTFENINQCKISIPLIKVQEEKICGKNDKSEEAQLIENTAQSSSLAIAEDKSFNKSVPCSTANLKEIEDFSTATNTHNNEENLENINLLDNANDVKTNGNPISEPVTNSQDFSNTENPILSRKSSNTIEELDNINNANSSLVKTLSGILEAPSLSTSLNNIENSLTQTKKILEIPYINSEIGSRPSFLNETSHNVPNINLNDSQYVPTINTDVDFEPQFDTNNLDVNQNCTITSEYCTIDEWNGSEENTPPEKLTAQPICDKTKEVPEETNLLVNNSLITSTPNVIKVPTGVKRRAPSCDSDESTKKKYKYSLPQEEPQPSASTHQNVPILNDHVDDVKERADNNDPKWKLFHFSEPQDFFQAVRNQWCMPMPNPHVDLTRRVYNGKPLTSTSNYSIPGNKNKFNVECLKIYEDQLNQIKAESGKLKYDLDMNGQYWRQRRINSTIEKIRNLDQKYDTLRGAWDDAYHFYTFSTDSKSNNCGDWYMSEFNENEILRSIQMLNTYEDYYRRAE